MFLYVLSIIYSISMTIACSKLQDSHVRIVNTDTKNVRGLGRDGRRSLSLLSRHCPLPRPHASDSPLTLFLLSLLVQATMTTPQTPWMGCQ